MGASSAKSKETVLTLGSFRLAAISERSWSLGRDALCDIPLARDPLVSRDHVRIRHDNGRYFVEDVGSLNGTWLNGERLSVGRAYVLKSGDVLEVGTTRLALSATPRANPTV